MHSVFWTDGDNRGPSVEQSASEVEQLELNNVLTRFSPDQVSKVEVAGFDAFRASEGQCLHFALFVLPLGHALDGIRGWPSSRVPCMAENGLPGLVHLHVKLHGVEMKGWVVSCWHNSGWGCGADIATGFADLQQCDSP